MKKFVTVIAVVLLVGIFACSFMGCKDSIGDKSDVFKNVEDFKLVAPTMGGRPTASPVAPINKDMKADEMFWAAIDNFYGADFAMSRLTGAVTTSVKIGAVYMPVTQWIVGTMVRDGKSTDKDARYFVDNKSNSQFAHVYEENIVDANSVRYRNGSKNGVEHITTGKNETEAIDTIVCKNLEKAKIEKFNTVDALVKAKVNDPRKIWMYDVAKEIEGCIELQGKPVYDKASDTYKFALVFNLEKVSVGYKAVMEHMLNMTVSCEKLNILGIKFNVVVHSNGFLRELNIQESYDMKVAGILDAKVFTESRRQFSYNKAEKLKIGKTMMDPLSLFARFK